MLDSPQAYILPEDNPIVLSLEARIKENVYDYEAHLDLIRELRTNFKALAGINADNEDIYEGQADTEKDHSIVSMLRKLDDDHPSMKYYLNLRIAREDAHKYHILPPQFWKEWCTDELKVFHSDVVEMFSYAIEHAIMEQPLDIELFLAIIGLTKRFEEKVRYRFCVLANEIGGYDLINGPIFWAEYLEILEEYRRFNELESERNIALEMPFIEYKKGARMIGVDPLLRVAELAEKISPHMKHLDTIEGCMNAARVTCWIDSRIARSIFERSLQTIEAKCGRCHPSFEKLWMIYLDYLIYYAKLDYPNRLDLAIRAIKYCPRSVALWCLVFMSVNMDRNYKEFSWYKELLGQAQSACIKNDGKEALWLYQTWCLFCYKWKLSNPRNASEIHMSSEFERLIENLRQNFNGKEWLELQKEYAKYALLTKDQTLYLRLVKDIIETDGAEANVWPDYDKIVGDSILDQKCKTHDILKDACEQLVHSFQRFMIDDVRVKFNLKENYSELNMNQSDPESSLSKKPKIELETVDTNKDGAEVGTKHEFSAQLPIKDTSRAIFVSNLLYELDEEKLVQFFNKYVRSDCVEEVRITRNSQGKSRGFGEVVFRDLVDVTQALSLDRTRIDGRPLFIKPYRDKSSSQTKAQSGHFEIERQPSTLYVSNLAVGTTEIAIAGAFCTFPGYKTVRLITAHSGRSKCFAYVDFETPEQAEHARIETDGKTLLDGRTLRVAISDPRKAPSRKSAAMAMIPRSCSLKPSKKIESD